MTTIAFKDGILAADRRVVSGRDTIVAPADKILKRGSRLIAVSGPQVALWAMAEWLDMEDRPKICPGMKDATGLIVEASGDMFMVQEGLMYALPKEPIAMGSGGDHAWTAMDMGADAETAVKMAARRDPFTGDGVTVLKL